MSNEVNESTVQAIIPLIKDYFKGEASKEFGNIVNDIQYSHTNTREKRGVTGSVLISDVTFDTEYGQTSRTIALKFFEDQESALNELANAMELEIRFKTVPEFGVPNVIFASTLNPILIIYEGVEGTNYDEISISNKQEEAGRLLATIHSPVVKPVDTEIYKNLIRMLGDSLSTLGMEKDISNQLSLYFSKLEGANSGCNPFSDFHQSNVMLTHYEDEIHKAYVIDPEFMQKGQFDRCEDIGTFFGFEMFNDYVKNSSVKTSLKHVDQFLKGYQTKNLENGGQKWTEMYPKGCPLQFFIAQWALMDALDLAVNRGKQLDSPEIKTRLDFTIYILQNITIKFPN